MENYVIYDDLRSDNEAISYKGRRKGTINFVAVQCIEKRYRALVTNAVRMLHSFDNENIVKFLEWYETSNHLWVVSEILSGGSLADIIDQDHYLPEDIVRNFGADICKGLHYLHSNSVVLARLSPDVLSLDAHQRLKLTDFRFARGFGEDVGALYNQVLSKEESQSQSSFLALFMAKPQAFSPEVLVSAHPLGSLSPSSDIWSLGVCLYWMLAGRPPYEGKMAEAVLREISRGDFEIPDSRRKCGRGSEVFVDLLRGLLKVERKERLLWPEIVDHPFWNGQLKDVIVSPVEMADTQSTSPTDVEDSLEFSDKSIDNPEENGDKERINSSMETSFKKNIKTHGNSNFNSVGVLLESESNHVPRLAQPIAGDDDLFRLSLSRCSIAEDRKPSPASKIEFPLSVDSEDDGDVLTYHPLDLEMFFPYPDRPKGLVPKFDANSLSVKLPPSKASNAPLSSVDLAVGKIEEALAAPSSRSKLQSSQKQISAISYLVSLGSSNRSGLFVPQLVLERRLEILPRLVNLLKSNVAEESVRQQAAHALSVLLHVTSENLPGLDCVPGLDLNYFLLVVSEVVRDGTTSRPLRSLCLVVLLNLFRLWSRFFSSSLWYSFATPFPSLSLTVIARGLRLESSVKDDPKAISACLRIVSLLSITCYRLDKQRSETKEEVFIILRSKLKAPELTGTLWTLLCRVPETSLRCLAASCLVAISRLEPSALYSCVDRAGLLSVVGVINPDADKRPASREAKPDAQTTLLNQLTTTLLCVLLQNPPHALKISSNKELLRRLLYLNDNPSPYVRSKVWLALTSILSTSRDAFTLACKSRLIAMIEREIRQCGEFLNVGAESWKTDANVYLALSLKRCIERITTANIEIVKDASDSLTDVSGRRHPSANQTLRLKNSVPHLASFHLVLCSSALREFLLRDASLLSNLVTILTETPSLVAKTTNLDPALGSGQSEETVKTILSIFETLAVSTKTFAANTSTSFSSDTDHQSNVLALLLEGVLPPLVEILRPASVSVPHALRLTMHLLDGAIAEPSAPLEAFIVERLFPRFAEIISGTESSAQNLSPSVAMGVVHNVLVLSPHTIAVESIPSETQISVAAACHQLLEYNLTQGHVLTPTFNQSLVVLATLLASSTKDKIVAVAVFPPLWVQALEKHNLVSFLVSVVKSVQFDIEDLENDLTQQFLEASLFLLHTMLQFVSERIRFALSSRRHEKNIDADAAESLLLSHRPLIRAFSPLLHHLMVAPDSDLSASAVASLSQLAQLFGGDHHPPLTPQHLRLYARALSMSAVTSSKAVKSSATATRRRTVLRTLKRLMMVGGKDNRKKEKKEQYAAMFKDDFERNDATSLFAVLSRMSELAASHADVGLASTAREIIETFQF